MSRIILVSTTVSVRKNQRKKRSLLVMCLVIELMVHEYVYDIALLGHCPNSS